jgi:hypothetical protein
MNRLYVNIGLTLVALSSLAQTVRLLLIEVGDPQLLSCAARDRLSTTGARCVVRDEGYWLTGLDFRGR